MGERPQGSSDPPPSSSDPPRSSSAKWIAHVVVDVSSIAAIVTLAIVAGLPAGIAAGLVAAIQAGYLAQARRPGPPSSLLLLAVDLVRRSKGL
jgi:hypothetical protein